MSVYVTDLKVCHVGLFVCLEPVDRHGGREGAAGRPGYGPGQLWPVEPILVVGGHRQLGRRGPLPARQGGVGGPASLSKMGTVPG